MHFKSDLQQHRQLTLSAKKHKKWLKQLGTSNYANYSMCNPKHSAKYVCRTGTSASSTARAVTSYEMIRQRTRKYIKSVLDLFSIPNFYIRKGRPHGHRIGKKESDQEYHTANQLQKKCKKRQFLSIHDRFMRDAWFRKTMIELGRTEEMDKLANEDHTHICYRRRTQRIP